MLWMMKYVLVSFVCFCFVSVRMLGRIGMYMLIATGDWRAGMTHGITYSYNTFPIHKFYGIISIGSKLMKIKFG